MISAVSHVAIVVRDPERTARLFEQVFAAKVIRTPQPQPGPPDTFVHLGGIWLVLVRGESRPVRGRDHIAFRTTLDSLDHFASTLKSLGIEHQTAREGSDGQSLYFVDHDNNLFELHAGSLEVELDNAGTGEGP